MPSASVRFCAVEATDARPEAGEGAKLLGYWNAGQGSPKEMPARGLGRRFMGGGCRQPFGAQKQKNGLLEQGFARFVG
jgi:hypothetical protein